MEGGEFNCVSQCGPVPGYWEIRLFRTETSVPWLMPHGIIHLLKWGAEGRDTGAGCSFDGTQGWLIPLPSICHRACPFQPGAKPSLSSIVPSSLHVPRVADNDNSHYFS